MKGPSSSFGRFSGLREGVTVKGMERREKICFLRGEAEARIVRLVGSRRRVRSGMERGNGPRGRGLVVVLAVRMGRGPCSRADFSKVGGDLEAIIVTCTVRKKRML